MRVFKFGGASIKDADAVRNMASIVQRFATDKLVVVVSAMGKTTNSLEELWKAKLAKKDYKQTLESLYNYHKEICDHLFVPNHVIFSKLVSLFDQISLW